MRSALQISTRSNEMSAMANRQVSTAIRISTSVVVAPLGAIAGLVAGTYGFAQYCFASGTGLAAVGWLFLPFTAVAGLVIGAAFGAATPWIALGLSKLAYYVGSQMPSMDHAKQAIGNTLRRPQRKLSSNRALPKRLPSF